MIFQTLLFVLFIEALLAQNRPFPQAIKYPNCIKPSIGQTTLNNDVKAFYDYWKKTYILLSSKNSSQFYIKSTSTGGTDTAITNSEAMGYGMIIVSLMAGYDSAAKTYYDGLYNMFDMHRSKNNNNLMQWQVQKNEIPTNDGSATDGDMDIAYSLLLAHYQWGSTTQFPYLTRAKNMINKGLNASYIMSSMRLALSDDATTDIYSTRPSDWMFSHMRAYYEHTLDGTWKTLATNLYSIFNKIVTNYAPNTGLISDFVMYNIPQPAPPYKPQSDEGPNTGKYYYNSGRVPLRVVMDYCHYGTTSAKSIVERMIIWLKSSTNNNPANIKAGYDLSGTRIGNYQTSLFISPFLAASVTNTENQNFLTDGWNLIKLMKEDYFEDTYNMLCMLFISGNWWIPA